MILPTKDTIIFKIKDYFNWYTKMEFWELPVTKFKLPSLFKSPMLKPVFPLIGKLLNKEPLSLNKNNSFDSSDVTPIFPIPSGNKKNNGV